MKMPNRASHLPNMQTHSGILSSMDDRVLNIGNIIELLQAGALRFGLLFYSLAGKINFHRHFLYIYQ